MLGALFNRSQQGSSSSTGGQDVKTSLRNFVSHGNPVGYSEFLGTGQPTTSYGYEGDVYVDLTPDAMSLYGHDGNKWVLWSGPSSNSHFSHPKDSSRWLWCNGQRFGWLPKNGRVAYAQEPGSDPSYLQEDTQHVLIGRTQSELLTLSIAKTAEGPRKRKSFDAGPADDQAVAKKRKADVRENSTATDNHSHRSLSASIGPAPSVTFSPTIPSSNSAARSASYAEPSSASSQSFPFPLHPDERANLLREINDLRVASSLTQRQLAEANEQISHLQTDNDALRRALATALSRILTNAGIPIPNQRSTTTLDPARQPTPPPRGFSVEQRPGLPSMAHTKPLTPAPATPEATTSASAGIIERDITHHRALLDKTKVLIAAAHSQLDELAAQDKAQGPDQPRRDDMAPVNEGQPADDGVQQNDDEGLDEQIPERGETEAGSGDETEGEEFVGGEDEGVGQEFVENNDDEVGREPAEAGTIEDEHIVEAAPSDAPDLKGQHILTDDFNWVGGTGPFLFKADVGNRGDGQGLDLGKGPLHDEDTNQADLLCQWNAIEESVSEENEEGSTDTEEDQLFDSQADNNPQPGDVDDEDDEPSDPSRHAIVDHVPPDAVLGVLELDDNDDNDGDTPERSTRPRMPDISEISTQVHGNDNRNTLEHRSIAVVEPIQERETDDLDKDKCDIPPNVIAHEESVHDAPVNGRDIASPPPSEKADHNDPGISEREQNMSQEPKAAVDDVKDQFSMDDKPPVPLPQPRPRPDQYSQVESETRSITPSQPLSWITRIPLPILFAKTKKYQLCRFCLTSNPQVFTKFPLSLDLPAMKAHCNEKHEEYCSILLDLSPQDLQGLLNAEASAHGA